MNKKVAIIPTLLTLGNAVCGLVAIMFASKIQKLNPLTDVNFAHSAWFLFAAMIFDALDGFAARLSRTASEFGGQLDSLCDAISFGVAPAFLLIKLGQDVPLPLYRQALGVVAALFMCCTLLRLARFNLENSPEATSHKRFRGLPSPAAAGCLASLAMVRGLPDFPHFNDDHVLMWIRAWALVGTLAVALMMVSRFSFPHLVNQLLRGRRHFSHLIQIILVVGLLFITYEVALFVLFWGYALIMPLRQGLEKAFRYGQGEVAGEIEAN